MKQLPRPTMSVRVAVIVGDTSKIVLMNEKTLGSDLRKHLCCADIDFFPISEVHTLYVPLDGACAGWKVLVRATDTSGEHLVDVTDEDVRNLPAILSRNDATRASMTAQ